MLVVVSVLAVRLSLSIKGGHHLLCTIVSTDISVDTLILAHPFMRVMLFLTQPKKYPPMVVGFIVVAILSTVMLCTLCSVPPLVDTNTPSCLSSSPLTLCYLLHCPLFIAHFYCSFQFRRSKRRCMCWRYPSIL